MAEQPTRLRVVSGDESVIRVLLQGLLAEQLGMTTEAPLDVPLAELGVDSLDMLELVIGVEEELEIELDDYAKAMNEKSTLADVAAYVAPFAKVTL